MSIHGISWEPTCIWAYRLGVGVSGNIVQSMVWIDTDIDAYWLV